MLAVNVPPVPLIEPPILIVLEPKFKVPAVRVKVPEKVCVKAVPKLSVPAVAFIVKPEPEIFPVKVAVPDAFEKVTKPVVVNPAMLWVAMVLSMTIGELPAVNVPELVKLPPKLTWKFPVFNDAPELIANGIDALNTLAAFIVMIPVLAMFTPPVAANGVIHSTPAVLAVVVLYRSVAAAP